MLLIKVCNRQKKKEVIDSKATEDGVRAGIAICLIPEQG
jgi:hypothetical protein